MKTFRKILFWCHLLAGVTAGMIVLVMSVTGVLLTYEKQMTNWADKRAYRAALAAPGAYNFILVAMALGGLFLVPSPSSYLIAGAAVVVTVPVLDATGVIWAQHGMAAFPLAFNLVTLAALYALGQAGHRGLVALPGRSPEETLELDLSWRRRHPGTLRTLRLPL